MSISPDERAAAHRDLGPVERSLAQFPGAHDDDGAGAGSGTVTWTGSLIAAAVTAQAPDINVTLD